MKHYIILAIAAAFLTAGTTQIATASDQTAAARGVLKRTLGRTADQFTLSAIPSQDGRDVYEVEAANGKVIVKGSSPVAICRGAYDYVRNACGGIVQWTGTRLPADGRLPDYAKKRVVSPYQHHYYFNVVTYGYTMPFWDWNRWQKELDWMALHGMDMPLAMVGTEAILDRVWKKIGLTQAESDEFFTGPAYAPWNRMGNIIKWAGPPPQSWYTEQIALQKKILARMRELGMQPIAPAFAGFVPPGIKRLYPDLDLKRLSWGGFAEQYQTPILPPDSPLFQTIGKMYVEEWEKEFGKAKFFLADSFNEMDVPLPPDTEAQRKMLSGYGECVYKPIVAADPDATWVMQGWTFGYSKMWENGRLAWLLEKVPNNKLLILDLANDYYQLYKKFDSFYGKQWIYSVIPNMGGKVPYTGKLDFYASGSVEALDSPNKGNLVGFGFAPEGIENNEVIYELLSDMGWQSTGMNLDNWLADYCKQRYGAYPPAMKQAWDLLRQTVYGSFTGQPRFGWQLKPSLTPKGYVNGDPRFFTAVEDFLQCSDQFKDNPLYRADAIELTAIYLGHKVDELFINAGAAQQAGQVEARDTSEQMGMEMLLSIDRLLESHPNHRLERWIAFARAHGKDQAMKDYYEANAKRLITTWGGVIDDYSARVWSGTIRDYYVPRWKLFFESLRSGKQADFSSLEEQWINTSGISAITPYPDPLAEARNLIAKAKSSQIPPIAVSASANEVSK